MAQYISKRGQLRLVLRPTDRTMDEQRRLLVIQGKNAEFFDHYLETNDPELVKFLDNHPRKGKDFDRLESGDLATAHQAVKRLKSNESIRLVTGAKTTADQERAVQPPPIPAEVTTRPTDAVAISPELIRIIDDRINSAMGTIIDLLKKDTKKEEKIMEGKPTKSFSCPYCSEVFSSGFKVGAHKKECPKKP